jgi:hypothetical protein
MIAFILLKISDKIMDEDVDVGQDTQVGQYSCIQTAATCNVERAAHSFSKLLQVSWKNN